jgi:hypothetical protein
LTFGDYFNQQICLNNTITHLKFGKFFNQPIELNDELTHLKFGKSFNQPIKLNDKLIYLEFGENFNQPIKLNNELIHLEFGENFNQPINIYETKLKSLVLKNKINEFINLPNTLEYLYLDSTNEYVKYLIDNLNNNLIEIEFGTKFNIELNNLPNSIKKLNFESCDYVEDLNVYNGEFERDYIKNHLFNKSIDNLPDSIETLRLPHNYIIKTQKIPKNLKKIYSNEKYFNNLKKLNIKIDDVVFI